MGRDSRGRERAAGASQVPDAAREWSVLHVHACTHTVQHCEIHEDFIPPSLYPTGPSPSVVPCLGSRDSLVEESIGGTGITSAHSVADETTVELSENVWKKRRKGTQRDQAEVR